MYAIAPMYNTISLEIPCLIYNQFIHTGQIVTAKNLLLIREIGIGCCVDWTTHFFLFRSPFYSEGPFYKTLSYLVS